MSRMPSRALAVAFATLTPLAATAHATLPPPSWSPVHGHANGHGPPLTRTYAGATSQHLKISFNVTNGYLENLRYKIDDTCAGGRRIRDYDRGFTRSRIRRSRIHASFTDPRSKAKATVRGTLAGNRATGTLTESTTYRGAACHGRASFSLTAARKVSHA